MCKLVGDASLIDLKIIGAGHHGHIMFLFVHSMSDENEGLPGSAKRDQLAIVGDMVRSMSVVKYYEAARTQQTTNNNLNISLPSHLYTLDHPRLQTLKTKFYHVRGGMLSKPEPVNHGSTSVYIMKPME
jgi:hypothetical protein